MPGGPGCGCGPLVMAALEGRTLLSTIVVNNPTDTPVTGQTDHAARQSPRRMRTAGATRSSSLASFNSPQKITLTGGQARASSGTKAGITITDPSTRTTNTVSGNGAGRVFTVYGGSAALSGLTISGGSADVGGGLEEYRRHAVVDRGHCQLATPPAMAAAASIARAAARLR